MSQKKKRSLSKRSIITIILSSLAVLAVIGIIVLNVFIPVKYLSAYIVGRDINKNGQMRVNFIDVGYGDSTVVEFPDGKVLLIDGGNGTYSNNLKLLKGLNSCGIDKIDYLVCSSVANETCGGLSEVLKYKHVEKAFIPYCTNTYITTGYRNFYEELKTSGVTTEICEYGSGVVNDEAGYCFLVISPSPHTNGNGEYAQLNSSGTLQNIKDASAVVWLECGGVSFLLLGNAGKEVQQKLVTRYNEIGIEVAGKNINFDNCPIVKVADNGSEAGNCIMLYDLIKPKTAIISVGENGRGCPSISSLGDVFNYVKDELYRTDEDGTVTVNVSDGTYSVHKEKR